MVHEILGRVFHRDVLGIAIHRADEPVDDILVELRQLRDMHSGHAGELTCGVICPEGSPMMVGAQVYVFMHMV